MARAKHQRTEGPQAPKAPKAPPAGNSSMISVWEQDHGKGDSSDGGLPVQQTAPSFKQSPFAFYIENPTNKIPPKIYNPGTAEFRFCATAGALDRGSQFPPSWRVFPTRLFMN